MIISSQLSILEGELPGTGSSQPKMVEQLPSTGRAFSENGEYRRFSLRGTGATANKLGSHAEFVVRLRTNLAARGADDRPIAVLPDLAKFEPRPYIELV